MLDVLKVRIYPNQEQEISLAKSFGCSRFVWNFYLNKTNTQYKVHGKISNTRQDFLHKLLRQLCDENQVIVAENLCIKGLARTKLAKSVYDAGFGMLLNFISYKLEREGGKFVQVDRFFPSSKLCSCCGHQHDVLDLSIREWTCPSCQTTQDRDENAARNLRAEGIKNTGNKYGRTYRNSSLWRNSKTRWYLYQKACFSEARISRYTALRLAARVSIEQIVNRTNTR
jgi:IS605 OrfB family transposase